MSAALAVAPGIDALVARGVKELSEQRFVTVAGAALIADSHPETVRSALRSGELHGSQRVKGGTWKIRPACVEAWVDGEACEHRETSGPVSLHDFRMRRSGGGRA